MTVSLDEFSKALDSLKEALSLPVTDIVRDASIQRFEFTLELAWKTAKKVMGSASSAPKTVIREMAQEGLIDDPLPWLDYIEARNLTVHTYNRQTAERVFHSAQLFAVDAQKLLERLRKV